MAPVGLAILAFVACAQLPAKGLRKSAKGLRKFRSSNESQTTLIWPDDELTSQCSRDTGHTCWYYDCYDNQAYCNSNWDCYCRSGHCGDGNGGCYEETRRRRTVPPRRRRTVVPSRRRWDNHAPTAGNAAWVGLHSVNAGTITIRERVGTQHTLTDTQTELWANEVSKTLSHSMQGGVGFKGLSIDISIGGELSTFHRTEQSTTQSDSWERTVEEEYELTLPPNSGYLWQWQIRTQLKTGEVYTSKTRNFALTEGLFEKPRCVPGYQTDGAACQVCFDDEASIQGLPEKNDALQGSIASKGVLLGSIGFCLLQQVLQGP